MSLLLLLCLACPDSAPPSAPAEAFPVAAARTTFSSSAALGAYVLEAHTETTTERGGTVEVVKATTRLRWKDDDHWQWTRTRDGETLSDTRVWEGTAWVAEGSGGFERRADAEQVRVELGLQADPWAAALGPNAERVAYTEAGEEDIEGRRVWRYTLGLTPGAPGGRKSRDVLAVDGQVWIDQATAVRLAGDLTVQTRFREQVRTTHLRFALADLGGDPGVEPPPSP